MGQGQKKQVVLRFPFKGVDGSAPLSAMPEGSCPDMLNMFPVAPSGQVSARRMVGAKRTGLETALTTFQTSDVACVSLKLWETVFKDTATTLAPISMLVMGSDQDQIQISIVTDTVPAAVAAAINTPNIGSTSSLLRCQFAQLGTKLFVLGPTQTGANLGLANGFYLNSLENVNAVPSTANAWTVEGGLGINGVVNGADLCCTYRASVVVAASREAIFKVSQVGDGQKFTPNGDPTGAYVGNSSAYAGVPGDGIVALVPFGDESLMFGCISSLWMLTGDPRSGGRVANLTTRVGILNKSAWCFDRAGAVWFIGSDYGLYRLARGEKEPIEMLKGRADYLIKDVLQAATGRTVFLEYDVVNKRVLVFVTPTAPAASNTLVSLAYSPEIDAIYPFSFASGVGSPNCAFGADWGDIYIGVYCGSGSGHHPVMKWSAKSTVTVDALSGSAGGTANYECRIRFASIEPDQGSSEWSVDKLEAVASQGCGPATGYWLTADSADQVQRKTYSSDYDVTFSLFADGSGYQGPRRFKARGAAHQLALSATTTTDVRLESFRVTLEQRAMQRNGA